MTHKIILKHPAPFSYTDILADSKNHLYRVSLAHPEIYLLNNPRTFKHPMSESVVGQLALFQVKECLPDYIKMRTDGLTNDHESTLAFVVPTLDHRQSTKLEHRSPSTTSELYAALVAARTIRSPARRGMCVAGMHGFSCSSCVYPGYEFQ